MVKHTRKVNQFIFENVKTVRNIYKFESNIIKLSTQSWVDRILNSNIIEEITELCENEDNKDITNDITENYKKCISDSLKTLDFYEDIPKEAIEKTIKLLLNEAPF